MSFTAKDVQALRQATGAGMLDCKKALEETGGDVDAAKQYLREKGLAASAKRDDRENTQGVVAILIDGNVGAIVKLKCETDFVASSEQFKAEAQALVELVAAKGVEATAERTTELEELKITLKEKIELGEVVRIEAGPDSVLDSYEHVQGGRGVNAVLVEIAGGTRELAHDIAVHIAFTKPPFLDRSEVPEAEIEAERANLEAITRAEGKPEQAVPKIVEGRLNAWLKERVLLEQGFVRDDKQTISALLGDATLVRFAQVYIGA